mmetsp:Transcript_24991/g.32631  ORF Transcript_24991/g.32631 Transcript_24991/m.32631 type:complete len:213 (-) Transcript_24991:255-893(-)
MLTIPLDEQVSCSNGGFRRYVNNIRMLLALYIYIYISIVLLVIIFKKNPSWNTPPYSKLFNIRGTFFRLLDRVARDDTDSLASDLLSFDITEFASSSSSDLFFFLRLAFVLFVVLRLPDRVARDDTDSFVSDLLSFDATEAASSSSPSFIDFLFLRLAFAVFVFFICTRPFRLPGCGCVVSVSSSSVAEARLFDDLVVRLALDLVLTEDNSL